MILPNYWSLNDVKNVHIIQTNHKLCSTRKMRSTNVKQIRFIFFLLFFGKNRSGLLEWHVRHMDLPIVVVLTVSIIDYCWVDNGCIDFIIAHLWDGITQLRDHLSVHTILRWKEFISSYKHFWIITFSFMNQPSLCMYRIEY